MARRQRHKPERIIGMLREIGAGGRPDDWSGMPRVGITEQMYYFAGA
ncbi:MAG TPA: hypothetical protein VF226_16155 [Hyphomicrobiaceae bacterium]